MRPAQTLVHTCTSWQIMWLAWSATLETCYLCCSFARKSSQAKIPTIESPSSVKHPWMTLTPESSSSAITGLPHVSLLLCSTTLVKRFFSLQLVSLLAVSVGSLVFHPNGFPWPPTALTHAQTSIVIYMLYLKHKSDSPRTRVVFVNKSYGYHALSIIHPTWLVNIGPIPLS